MKICFVAPADNYHTIKWAKWFSMHGYDVHIITFVNAEISNCTIHFIDVGADVEDSDFRKIRYLFGAKEIHRIVRKINPDIVNAHYATSYGAAVALSGIKKYILSVWGSDVYDFPHKSIIHKALLVFSLNRASLLFSTSKAMALETKKYTKKKIEITPFGVDMNLFHPELKTTNRGKFVIGTIKSLEEVYGIEYLLRAVSAIKEEYPKLDIELRIAGEGSKKNEYQNLAEMLNISDITIWLGYITQEEAACEWANMDVAVIYSVQESFGVSAIEAQACKTSVIISDIPGLRETSSPGKTSIAVESENVNKLKDAILHLYKNPHKRIEMGKNGRKYVESKYEINRCFEKIERLYMLFLENQPL